MVLTLHIKQGVQIFPPTRIQAHRLETLEHAELQYNKREKKEKPVGGDIFNPKSLYNAYKKRAENVPYTKEDYEVCIKMQ